MTTVWRGRIRHGTAEAQKPHGATLEEKYGFHEHNYKDEVLNRQGVALSCSCGARAQWISTWNLKEAWRCKI